MPSDTGEPGGKKVGQSMTHYIIAGGTFDIACDELLTGQFHITWIDRLNGHCCKVSDEAAFCLIQRPYISKTLLTRRISPRGSP